MFEAVSNSRQSWHKFHPEIITVKKIALKKINHRAESLPKNFQALLNVLTKLLVLQEIYLSFTWE